jgi:DNA-binding PadR family transcriptional regulator
MPRFTKPQQAMLQRLEQGRVVTSAANEITVLKALESKGLVTQLWGKSKTDKRVMYALKTVNNVY